MNLDDLLKVLPDPIETFKNGEKRKTGKVNSETGANYDVSDADLDRFTDQKNDAISFLRNKSSEIKRAMSLPGVNGATLDFGVKERDVYVQCDYLEPILIKLAGDLGIGIEISRYPCREEGDDS